MQSNTSYQTSLRLPEMENLTLMNDWQESPNYSPSQITSPMLTFQNQSQRNANEQHQRLIQSQPPLQLTSVIQRRRTIRSKSLDPSSGQIKTKFYRGNKLYILLEYMENDTIVYRSSTYLVSKYQSLKDAEELADQELARWKNSHQPTVVIDTNNIHNSRVAWSWPQWEGTP